jgi:hypothetical protein
MREVLFQGIPFLGLAVHQGRVRVTSSAANLVDALPPWHMCVGSLAS